MLALMTILKTLFLNNLTIFFYLDTVIEPVLY